MRRMQERSMVTFYAPIKRKKNKNNEQLVENDSNRGDQDIV